MFDFTWRNEKAWKDAGGDDAIPAPPPDAEVLKASLLFWEEHCVECSIPECYSTCRLYVARKDQKCARFVYGIYPNDRVGGLLPNAADVSFRRWAKLEAKLIGPPRMLPVAEIRRLGRWEDRLGGLANVGGDLLQIVNPKRRINGAYTYARTRWLDQRFVETDDAAATATGFYIKFFYPGQSELQVNIEFHQSRLVFRDGIVAKPGWNEKLIPVGDFRISPDAKGRVLVSLSNDREERLIFTWLDFVTLAPRPATTSSSSDAARPTSAKKVK